MININEKHNEWEDKMEDTYGYYWDENMKILRLEG